MSAAEIVDPTQSPASDRRRIFQILGPLVGVFLVIAAITGISLHNYQTTRKGAISLSNDLLRSQQRYVTQEVSDYLAPASIGALIAQDMFRDPLTNATPNTFMLYGRSILTHTPQVDSFYIANDQGQFWMITRHGEDGFEQTHFQTDDGKQVYHHVYTDKDGNVTGESSDPAEGYNVITRPWFAKAVKHQNDPERQLHWTDPYAYISTHQFIITASLAFDGHDGHKSVFAINISLNQLTSFLNKLQVGRSGQAVIVDMHGQIIAGHNVAAGQDPKTFDPGNVFLDPKTQPVFIHALNRFRIKGPGTGVVQARGRNYVTIASELPFVHRHWVLLLNAPESDFADFAQTARRQNIGFSLLVVGLASILALALVAQGRHVERLRKQLQRGRDQVRAENASLLEIASTPDLFDPAHEVPILTEALTARTSARRASLWRLLPDGDRLLCEDAFDPARDVHSTGVEISQRENGKLFEALEEGHTLSIADASQDERTQNFQRVIMRAVGANTLLFQPVRNAHKTVGAIVLEDPGQPETMEHIIAIVASIVALRFAKPFDGAAEDGKTGLTVPAEKHDTRFDEGFLLAPSDTTAGEPVAAGVYPQVPVMVISFVDPYASDRDSIARAMNVIRALSLEIQKIARDSGLFSVQVVSNRLVLVGGCSQTPDPSAAVRLADAAVSIREACLSSLAAADLDPVFRIGMDVGSVMASELGESPSVFNIWGDALNGAELLTGSAPDAGTIQVSEQAYMILREHFLFRARGMFYLPNSGITRSFILAGRR
ncbi:cache domain-containing protein [Gluconobacter roseus]|uniref:cache domain-containing protein n=1 Tax=Gluconobacter roseus TaxID=586239 RepID=UPI0038D13F9C